jgi:hypothetical protein
VTLLPIVSKDVTIKNSEQFLPAALSRALALRAPTARLGICPSGAPACGIPLVGDVPENKKCRIVWFTKYSVPDFLNV